MRRSLAALVALCAACMCFSSCGGKQETVSETETVPVYSVETETQETTMSKQEFVRLSAAERAKLNAEEEGVYIFDECEVLSDKDLDTLNTAAAKLAEEQEMCAAVVITEHLGGADPKAFAAEYYNALYGGESTGFLVLINNETHEDHVHTSGACSMLFTDEMISLAIAKATPCLVEEDYASALQILLELGEQEAPYVYDPFEILSTTQYEKFSSIAQEAAEDTGKRYCVLLVNPEDWMTEETTSLQVYADAQREFLRTDGILVIDAHDLHCAVSGDFSNPKTMAAELMTVLQETGFLPITTAVTAYYDKVKALY